MYHSKGEHAKLRRWFSWVEAAAAAAQDKYWHLRLLTILSMGVHLGLYNTRAEFPRSDCHRFIARPLYEETENLAAERIQASAAASTASSSTDLPPTSEPKGLVRVEDVDLTTLRSKAKNTLFFCG